MWFLPANILDFKSQCYFKTTFVRFCLHIKHSLIHVHAVKNNQMNKKIIFYEALQGYKCMPLCGFVEGNTKMNDFAEDTCKGVQWLYIKYKGVHLVRGLRHVHE